jgi:hypothetical protein
MHFKTKDLLVTVLPKAEIADAELAKLCLLRTFICRYPTIIDCRFSCLIRGSFCGGCSRLLTLCDFCSWQGTGGCGFFNSCGPGGSACDPTRFCYGSGDPFVIQNLEDLATLKAELQATLKSLDAIQKEGLPSSIGSKSEAEALERGLTEALEQVRSAKKKL